MFRDHGSPVVATPNEEISSVQATQSIPPWFEPQASPTVTAFHDESSLETPQDCIEM